MKCWKTRPLPANLLNGASNGKDIGAVMLNTAQPNDNWYHGGMLCVFDETEAETNTARLKI
jgi:hypothetical protein